MNYDFVALPDRKNLRWPGDKRLAVIITINLEYWELTRDQKEPLYPGGPASIPFPLPGDVPDYVNWTWREYGQRVGVWRVIDAFDAAGVPASCTVNGMYLQERRRAVEAVMERGWELVPHNWAQNDILTYYAHDPEGEREVIHRTVDHYREVVGAPARGWLSSSLRPTSRTVETLREAGLIFFCDFLNDDQPYLMDIDGKQLVSIPYSSEINDFGPFIRHGYTPEQFADRIKAQFDVLYEEGAESGRVMAICLHPFVIGVPHRIKALDSALNYICGHEHVWKATGSEIMDHYLKSGATF